MLIKLRSPTRAVLEAPLSTWLMDIVRQLPSFKKWENRQLVFEPTSAALDHLRAFIPDLQFDPSMQPVLDEIALLEAAAVENLLLKDATAELVDELGYEYGTAPFAHQHKVFLISRDRKVFALLMEMGTGKTKVLIDTAAFLWREGYIDGFLIAAPNGVHDNWIRQEIPRHMPKWVRYMAVTWDAGRNSQKYQDEINRLFEFNGLRIFAFNIEAFSTARGAEMAEAFLESLEGRSLMAVDESTRIGTPGRERTKETIRIGRKAGYRRIATGQPIRKGAEDLYSQMLFLDDNLLGFTSFYTFRNRYCVMGGFEMKQIIAYQRIDELQRKIEAHSFRVLKKDCLDLPDRVYETLPVELTKKQREQYDELRKNLIIELNDNVVTAPLAITKMLRLQQITCGHLPLEAGGYQWLMPPEENPRMVALDQALDELEPDAKAIIWCRFVADIEGLYTYLTRKRRDRPARNAVLYYGAVSRENRWAALQSFQNDPNTTIFIGQPRSGGIGLDLTAGSFVYYYSNDFSLEAREQSEARAHRQGQVNKVTYVDLEAIGTIDAKITAALREKRDIAAIINKDVIAEMLS